MKIEIFKQGAEARLYLCKFQGRDAVIKERFSKKYRHPNLDERLTKERVRGELRGILRCKAVGIRTPAVFFVDNKKNSICMELLKDVETVNLYITNILQGSEESRKETELCLLAEEVGKMVGTMHGIDLIHGDLTTSNILVTKNGPRPQLTLIDFGLCHVEKSNEDKAVDLYVLERALLSTHADNLPSFFPTLLEAYKKTHGAKGKEVLNKLDDVRLRGRKRTMIG